MQGVFPVHCVYEFVAKSFGVHAQAFQILCEVGLWAVVEHEPNGGDRLIGRAVIEVSAADCRRLGARVVDREPDE